MIIVDYISNMGGSNKAKVRTALAPDENIGVGLFLPGKEYRDVKQYEKMGRIDQKHSKVVWFEDQDGLGGRKDFVTHIDRGLTRMGINHEHIPGRLEDSILTDTFDYANIDLLCPISDNIAFWLNDQLVPNLARRSTVAITYRYNLRHTPSVKEAINIVTRTKAIKDVYEAMCDEMRIWDEVEWTTQFFLLCCTFNRFNFTALRQIKYQDSHTPMCVSKFVNLRRLPKRGTNGFPSINQIFSRRIQMKATSVKVTPGSTIRSSRLSAAAKKAIAKKQSDAGKKAWETRRANEKARVQSEAGKKAWATRRTNAKAKVQSEAGKKAWATRRANAKKRK